MSEPKPVCAVIGIGPGNGEAISRRFAEAGYAVAMLSRSTELSAALSRELDGSRAYECDASDSESVKRALDAASRDLGPVDVLVYNAGAGVFKAADDVSLDDVERTLRVNAVGALAAARAVVPGMRAAKRGNIVFIGATASRRGAAMTLGFAPGKAAQRSIAESLAKSLGPQGIHVSLVVIDGVIDLPRTRQYMPDKPDSFFLKPADIAETVLFLTTQKPSAWTFELEVRPFGEKW